MVVCLNNKDLNQPDRWLTSSLQASSLVPSKVVTVVHQLSPQVNMPSLKCNTEVLPALVDTVVVSPPQIPNGVPPPLRAMATALVATKDNLTRSTPVYELSGFAWSCGEIRDINSGSVVSSFFASVVLLLGSLNLPARPFSMNLHRILFI